MPSKPAEDDEMLARIKELLDTRVRPAGGPRRWRHHLHGFDRGIVLSAHAGGPCAGCPSLDPDLKMGIENLLRHYIPRGLGSPACCG